MGANTSANKSWHANPISRFSLKPQSRRASCVSIQDTVFMMFDITTFTDFCRLYSYSFNNFFFLGTAINSRPSNCCHFPSKGNSASYGDDTSWPIIIQKNKKIIIPIFRTKKTLLEAHLLKITTNILSSGKTYSFKTLFRFKQTRRKVQNISILNKGRKTSQKRRQKLHRKDHWRKDGRDLKVWIFQIERRHWREGGEAAGEVWASSPAAEEAKVCGAAAEEAKEERAGEGEQDEIYQNL